MIKTKLVLVGVVLVGMVLVAIVSVVCPLSATAAETAGVNTQEPLSHAAVELKVETIDGLGRQLRALQLVQDRMVTGNTKAVDAQRALLERLMADLETRNGLAALDDKDAELFLPMALLNGADPERIRSVLGQSGLTSKNAFLIGAIAYAEGRVADALLAFADVDAAALPPIARAQYHLTYGVMLAKTQPDQAMKNFAKARLEAPGTLIEEAALRREALLNISKPEVFIKLVRSYLHRFAASPFASAFISQFAFSIADLRNDIQNSIMSQLDQLLAPARSEDRQNFYSILARSSLIGGNSVLTDFATLRAVHAVKDPSQLLSARLYRAAFEIAGDNYVSAADELHSLMRVPLQASDREILSAAISVAEELRRWPFEQREIGSSAALPTRPYPDVNVAKNEPSTGILEAQKLLGETENLARPVQ